MLISEIENTYFNNGCLLLAGVDEAGRGPLAGPVVAACVSLPNGKVISNKLNEVNDSKKLTPKKREELFYIIKNEFEGIGVGLCNNNEIDELNILQASLLAMKRSLEQLKNQPDMVLVDGNFLIPNIKLKQACLINGDRLAFSVAAASIIAKVTRDEIMKEMHELFPVYGFDRHKGYGTKIHLENLNKFGPTEIHRKSFAPVANAFLVKKR